MAKDDQGFWNFVFSLFFGILFGTAMLFLYRWGRLPTSMPLFDFFLIALATFRLTRLFVYDKITQFVRDWFLVKEVRAGGSGELVVIRSAHVSGPLRTISELLACPWCFGVWSGLVVAFSYFATPFSWFPILVFAISGVGTLLQLLANMVGWRAERLKQEVERSRSSI